MGITVKGQAAVKLWKLLEKMDKGYVPSEEERVYLSEIETLNVRRGLLSVLPESFGNRSI